MGKRKDYDNREEKRNLHSKKSKREREEVVDNLVRKMKKLAVPIPDNSTLPGWEKYTKNRDLIYGESIELGNTYVPLIASKLLPFHQKMESGAQLSTESLFVMNSLRRYFISPNVVRGLPLESATQHLKPFPEIYRRVLEDAIFRGEKDVFEAARNFILDSSVWFNHRSILLGKLKINYFKDPRFKGLVEDLIELEKSLHPQEKETLQKTLDSITKNVRNKVN